MDRRSLCISTPFRSVTGSFRIRRRKSQKPPKEWDKNPVRIGSESGYMLVGSNLYLLRAFACYVSSDMIGPYGHDKSGECWLSSRYNLLFEFSLTI